jgi:hypothetical protein
MFLDAIIIIQNYISGIILSILKQPRHLLTSPPPLTPLPSPPHLSCLLPAAARRHAFKRIAAPSPPTTSIPTTAVTPQVFNYRH